MEKKLSAVKLNANVVHNLGTFRIKRKALEEKIKKSILLLKKIETDIDISVQTYELIIQKRKDIADYLQLLELMKSEQNRKQEVKLKKQEFKDGKSN